jgi:hypothetical protein
LFVVADAGIVEYLDIQVKKRCDLPFVLSTQADHCAVGSGRTAAGLVSTLFYRVTKFRPDVNNGAFIHVIANILERDLKLSAFFLRLRMTFPGPDPIARNPSRVQRLGRFAFQRADGRTDLQRAEF